MFIRVLCVAADLLFNNRKTNEFSLSLFLLAHRLNNSLFPWLYWIYDCNVHALSLPLLSLSLSSSFSVLCSRINNSSKRRWAVQNYPVVLFSHGYYLRNLTRQLLCETMNNARCLCLSAHLSYHLVLGSSMPVKFLKNSQNPGIPRRNHYRLIKNRSRRSSNFIIC